MQIKPIANKGKFLVRWILGNTFGMAVVMPIVTLLSYVLILEIFGTGFRIVRKVAVLLHVIESDNTSWLIQAVRGSEMPIDILVLAIPSLLFALFQWLILRTHIVNARRWIWASFIGIEVGILILLSGNHFLSDGQISEVSLELRAGVLIGTTLGVAQWLILRQSVNYSSFWVVANILGLSIGMVWGYPYFSSSGSDDIGIVLYFAAFVFRLIITHSVITGVLLIWLFHQPSKQPQTIAA